MKYTPLFLLIALMLSVAGCRKVNEFQDAEIQSGDAEFAIPLAKAKTTIQDLLENFDDSTYIEITPDGIIHLRYRGDVLTQTAQDFFSDAESQLPPLIPLEDTLYALPFSTAQQLAVDFATYKTGSVRFIVKSQNYTGTIHMKLTIPQATKNGIVATVEEDFASPTTGIGGYYFSAASVDMSGYNLEPTNGTVYIRYEAYDEQGNRLKFPGSDITLLNEDVHFSYIEGYLGNFKHNGSRDTVDVNFFDSWEQGDVFFDKPNIYIHLENSFGVPTRSKIQLFDILTADNLRLPLESNFIDDTGIDFVYPPLDEVGTVRTMSFAFNADNSNIEDVLGSRPIALDYDVDAQMNPDSIVGLRGFVTDSSYYRIQVEVDLPIQGKASGFSIVDSFNVDFKSYNDVKEVEFKLVADNDMPLEVAGQGFFLDSAGVVLDSLFSEGKQVLVESASVGADGVVTERSTQTNFITFPAIRFDAIRQAKRLALKAYFSTYKNGQQSVKAFAGQGVELRLGMKVKT